MNTVWILRVLSLCGILAPLIVVIIIITAGLQIPGYNQLRDTISSLSDQSREHPELMIAGFVSYGLLVIGFSYGLYLNLSQGTRARLVLSLFTLYGICIILAGIFRASPVSQAHNIEGILHNTVVIISCLSIFTGMWIFARSVSGKPLWFGFTWFTIVASFMALLCSIVFITPFHLPFAGLIQRLFYIFLLIWIETVSIRTFRLSSQRRELVNSPQ
jgi:hypothetical membrane protein